MSSVRLQVIAMCFVQGKTANFYPTFFSSIWFHGIPMPFMMIFFKGQPEDAYQPLAT